MKYSPRTKPFAHQARAAITAVKKRNLAFLMDPGTGKTKAAIDAAFMLHLKGEVNKVVVCGPIAAMPVWRDELRDHAPTEHQMEWKIINYDKLSRRYKKGKKYVYPHIARVEKFEPDLLILDESHRCKRASSNRAQGLWRMTTRLRIKGHKSKVPPKFFAKPYVWLLTGTPNPKGYIDLFAQFRIMDPTIFGTAKAKFEDDYCQYGYGKQRFTIVKYRNKRKLLRLIRENSVTAPEPDLPPQLFQLITVKLPTKARRIYDTMAEDLLVQLEGDEVLEAKNVAVRRLRLRQIAGGFTTAGTPIHRAKLDAAQDLLYDLYEQREHVVVYAHFLAEVESLKNVCQGLGYEAVAITGATEKNARAMWVRRLQSTDPREKPMALVFQVATGSLSITLTAAKEVLFYSLPDGWDTWYQATKRVHRIGQQRSVRYRILTCPGTVDVSQLYTLQNKASMHHELMRTPNRFVYGRYSLDELRRGFDKMKGGR